MKKIFLWIILVLSVVLLGLFLYFCNHLVNKLSQEERAKVELWSEAYRQFIAADDAADMTMELKVMQSNTTIPVFFIDSEGNLMGSNNIDIPADTATFIARKSAELKEAGRYFDIEIFEGWHQYLYYDESTLLQQLHYYPYIQLGVILLFILLLYYMFMGHKRAEQNRVWVGLSKETAHQLGTPIQSLMGWMEYMKALQNEDLDDAVVEMNKDVQRLRTVADRFSKIGSEPKMEETDLIPLIEGVVDYMQKRAPRNISLDFHLPLVEDGTMPRRPVTRKVCAPLFSWVIENLCRNAIDAMPDGRGAIHINMKEEIIEGSFFSPLYSLSIEVTDTGKGIPKNKWKTIFQPGYTTKQRGWGLGLALVKRIVEEYHHGQIFVQTSVIGQGTTFRIEL